MKYVKAFLLVVVALFAVNAASAYAEPAAYTENINLEVNSSKYVKVNKRIARIFIGNGKIIHVHQPSNSTNEFVVTAQDKEGSTTLFLWTADGLRYEYLVNVSKEEYGQAALIEKAINLTNVHVKKVGDKILLTGTVKNQYERNYAVQTARLYVSGGTNNLSVGSNVDMTLTASSADESSGDDVKVNELKDSGAVIDLLTMTNPIQIRLEAQIVAIRPEYTKNLGFQYDGTTLPGYTPNLSNAGVFHGGEYFNDGDFRNNPWKWFVNSRAGLNYSLNALITDSKAKILSRPSIMTMSGEQATIRVGGEIPYSVRDSDGTYTTKFKDYGIILQLKPVVDGEGRIISAIHAEVSSLGTKMDDGNYMLDQRRAEAVVTMEDGSTMVIGGLMDSSERKVVTKIPLLGDIPILGEFFKYTSKSKDDQELVILVTPYIIDMDGTTHTSMSDEMRDFYQNGKRKKDALNDVDLNELPPPFTEEDKKPKKYKKSKKNKKAEQQVQTEVNDDAEVEVFGGNY